MTAPANCQSALTTGKSLLTGIDLRKSGPRRYRDLVEAFSPTGEASPIVHHLARRASGLCLAAERVEADLALGKSVDQLSYAAIARALSEVLCMLEMERPQATGPDPEKPTLNTRGARTVKVVKRS